MRHSVITLLLFCTPLFSLASPKAVNDLFHDFTQKKLAFLKSDLNKKNLKTELDKLWPELDSSFEKVKDIEAKIDADNDAKGTDEDILTPEGNEMGYVIEILEPLRTLSNGLMNAEACEQAYHEHEMNFPVITSPDGDAIKAIIQKICPTPPPKSE
jgi:hypothetical protein